MSYKYNYSVVSCVLASALLPVGHVIAEERFNPALLEMTESKMSSVDLSAFEKGEQAPGTYRLDVFINNEQVDTQDITFISSKDARGSTMLQACFTSQQLKSWGVKIEEYPKISVNSDHCADFSAIPQATSILDFNKQRLNVSIPQVALESMGRGYISPEKWDEGINALLFNYSLNGMTTKNRQGSHDTVNSQYGNFHPGVNIGPWRFRNYSTWSHDTNGENEWDSVNSYISRDIKPLRAQFTAGDSSTSGDIFDSMAFMGAQLSSDEDMTPDSLKGYAPVIRGIARTNAEVTVYQNGYSIYKTSVAPGPFEINDMFPTGGAGDMSVTIKESDGSEQHFTVAYASLPILQREGHFKYSTTMGNTRTGGSKDASFAELTAIYGLPQGFTVYSGIEATDIDFHSASLGLGVNLGDFGAISTDVTQAWSTINSGNQKNETTQKESGQSLRLRYSKNMLKTGTNVTIAGYRYSTSGYYSLQDTLQSYNYDDSDDNKRRKNRTELSIAQDIIYGSLSANLVHESYWNNKKESSVSLSYNNSCNGISYGLNYSYNISAENSEGEHDENDQQFSFNISVPLDKFLPSATATYSLNTSKNGPATHNIGMNGTAFDDRTLNWNVQEGYSETNKKTNGGVSANYKGQNTQLTGGYAYDANVNRLNYGVQGGILIHSEGITLSQPYNDTVVLVNTSGAEGIPLSNQAGIKTDNKGFAVVPYASPYRKNSISLSTDNLEDNNLELEETSKNVIPTRGAVVVAKYNANLGYRALITLSRSQGKPIPFGATVTNSVADIEKRHSSIVGDEQKVYFTGLDEAGKLLVVWGEGNDEQCTVNYHLPEKKSESGVEILHEKCN
ncbi:fimbria/pilus outer membrane usher protein [Buttiauxella sp. S04-F03]|uniref:fimbria/pilus outer membrane usher protein n=1 Tax=Buttiauxella sp. W03-F01 TaxID=2904524 RepID=UPI001E60ED4D|nr:fimbria/pilus outer membrane usher protein [Buttiauxella sp. W03-F01]MCE0798786.1 fimbria/pilus outer membrane usher protein [Buttiauxella sp. W03-F01]